MVNLLNGRPSTLYGAPVAVPGFTGSPSQPAGRFDCSM